MKELNDLQQGYMAGFLDADGCISITKEHVIELRFTGASYGALSTLQIWAGGIGSLYQANRKIREQQENLRRVYHWVIKGMQGRALLIILAEHLLIKRNQAALALESPCSARVYHKAGRGKGSVIPKAVQRQREKYRLALSNLKKANPLPEDIQIEAMGAVRLPGFE